MNISSVAKIYERSLVELEKESAVDAHVGGGVFSSFKKFMEIVEKIDSVRSILFLEVFSPAEKRIVLQELFKKTKFLDIFEKFLYYLNEERRLDFLPMIYQEFEYQESLSRGIVSGVIEGDGRIGTISDEDIKNLESLLEKRIKFKVKLKLKDNPEISAGYRIIVNDYLLDASIDYQINRFKEFVMVGNV